MNARIEKIQTGLTRNYVSYWTPRQALKEAAQNIAYGAVKSSRPVRLEWVDGIGFMEDQYVGFEKRFLYLGESEQREDAQDGLGNFGEGWKIFLLVMARSNLLHRVDTVGFSFWGEMEPTPHGPEVLVIHVEPNTRTQGTLVTAECSQEDFEAAISSFAPLQGIDCSDEGVIPGRCGELWINGVRIEQDANTNPLNLHYAYHLKDRTLMNRDRSQVNVYMAMLRIRWIITDQSEEFVREYVSEAMKGNTHDDIQKGPAFGYTSDQVIELWRQVIAEAHKTTPERLVLSSHNADIDKEALYRGFRLIQLPDAWGSELNFIGFKRADEVVKLKPNYVEVKDLSYTQAENLRKARLDTKRALGLSSVKDLPRIKVVEKITGDGYDYAQGMWDPDEQTIFIRASVLWDLSETVRILIHEAVHWQTGEGDNQPRFTRGFENAILRLLGHEVR